MSGQGRRIGHRYNIMLGTVKHTNIISLDFLLVVHTHQHIDQLFALFVEMVLRRHRFVDEEDLPQLTEAVKLAHGARLEGTSGGVKWRFPELSAALELLDGLQKREQAATESSHDAACTSEVRSKNARERTCCCRLV